MIDAMFAHLDQQGGHELVAVIDQQMYRLLSIMGYVCRQLGPKQRYEDGLDVLAVSFSVSKNLEPNSYRSLAA